MLKYILIIFVYSGSGFSKEVVDIETQKFSTKENCIEAGEIIQAVDSYSIKTICMKDEIAL